jgi:5-(carboxyamino)imidazole ribonucleotide mutase
MPSPTAPAASLPQPPLVGVIMGSKSDWETLRHAAEILEQFGVPHECRVVSAHRTPDAMNEYGKTAESRGLQVIIAGAGGAVGTLAIGEAGAKNAALLAVRILAATRADLRQKLHAYRSDLANKVQQETLP